MHRPAATDFERWRDLARDDPEAFERQRQATIEAAINRAPRERQVRLRRLQWRIDQVRGRSANPLAACVAVSGMMWDSLTGRYGLLAHLKGLHDRVEAPGSPHSPPHCAQVIPLQPRRGGRHGPC